MTVWKFSALSASDRTAIFALRTRSFGVRFLAFYAANRYLCNRGVVRIPKYGFAMKRLLGTMFLGILLFSACTKDEEGGDIVWDFWNYNMVFAVTDAAGRDLLDPAVEENVLGNDIRVYYRGEVYVPADDSRAMERGGLALRHGYDEEADRYVLAFGLFSPADQHHRQTFTIDWGDGTRNEVAFDCYVAGPEERPAVRKNLYLDGEQTEDTPYLIRLVK
mgnify:FL=1